MKLAWSTREIDQFTDAEFGVLLKTLNENGFAGIEPLYSSKPEFAANKLNQLQKYDQKIIGFRSGGIAAKYGVSFCSPDPKVRAQAVGHFTNLIHYASEIGVQLLLLGLLQGKLSPSQTYPEARHNIVECLEKCAYQAAKSQVTIGLEPVNHFLLDYHTKSENIIGLIKDLNMPNIGLLLDTYHMNLEEDSIEETLVSAAPWLIHVHFADDNHEIPGKGTLNFSSFVKSLKEINYQGYVSVEVDDADWMTSIPACSKLLLPLISE